MRPFFKAEKGSPFSSGIVSVRKVTYPWRLLFAKPFCHVAHVPFDGKSGGGKFSKKLFKNAKSAVFGFPAGIRHGFELWNPRDYPPYFVI